MIKHFPILDGKAYVVELPEGASDPHIIVGYDKHGQFPSLAYNGRGFEPIRLPAGNWQIVGRLSEVTEEEAGDIVDEPFVDNLEALLSAIEHEGWYFENPITTIDDNYAAIGDYYHNESRVLSRERTLILRRVE